MLETYLNQTSTLTRAQRNDSGNPAMDDRGKILYQSPVSVSCRKENQTMELLTSDSQIVKTNWVYYLASTVSIDDLIDGKSVKNVSEWVSLSGETLGYEAVV